MPQFQAFDLSRYETVNVRVLMDLGLSDEKIARYLRVHRSMVDRSAAGEKRETDMRDRAAR